MSETEPGGTPFRNTPHPDFTRLAEQFESLRGMPPAGRERALSALAVTDPSLTTELRRLFAQHDDDPEQLASPERAFSAAAVRSAMHEAGSEPPLPSTIGAYRPRRVIGRGGMGTVYLAERPGEDFEQLVAIKVLRAPTDDLDLQRRFRTERRILASLQHPNIAAMFDGGTTEAGQPFVVMEYVDGVDLLTHCREHQVDLAGRLQLFIKVCRAVAHAHRALVVHRDLKPGNILVTANGEPKLLDFGIAKVLQPEDSTTDHGPAAPLPTLTRTGNLLMTPEYSSPEQVRGERITTATDVYALGTILYELLSGQRAQRLDDRSLPSLLQVVCEHTAAAPSAVAPPDHPIAPQKLRGDLDTIVACALRKEPERRYESASALANDLERHLAGLPVAARGDSLAYRMVSFARRNRLALAAATVLLLMLLGFLASTLAKNRVIAEERDTAVTQKVVADRIAEFLVGLFTLAQPDPQRADALRVRELLDRGANRIDRDLALNPERRAPLQLAMGRAYEALGIYSAAKPLLTNAEATFASTAPGTAAHRNAQFWLGTCTLHLDESKAGEELVRHSVEPTRTGPPLLPIVVAQRKVALASWMCDAGRLAEADDLMQDAERLEPDIPPDELGGADDRRFGRSALLREEGKPDQSLALLLAIQRDAAARTDGGPGYTPLQRELGRTYKNLRNLDAARKACELDLAEARKYCGESHPDVDTALFALAMLEIDQGDLQRAESLLREILQRDELRFGKHHAYPALVRGQLAQVLGSLDRSEEAEPMFKEALALQRELLPKNHPELATTIANLATFYHYRHRWDEAMPLYKEALALREAVYPADHPILLTTRNQIAVVELEQGHLAAAEAELRKVLEARRRTLGTHDETAGSLLSLGAAIMRQNRYDEAIPLLQESIQMFGATLPATHPTQARPRNSLAICYLRIHKPELAEPLLRESIAISGPAIGTDHPDTCYAELLLGRSLSEQHRPADAIAVLRPLLERITKSHPGHRYIPQIRALLADELEASGDTAGAAALRK